jgi:hypothetical protein
MDIQKELARLDELRAALVTQLHGATSDDKIAMLEDAQPKIKHGSKEHASFLASGYGFTVEEARQIVKERNENPHLWPFEKFQQAKAMLEAFSAKPAVVSTRRPWRTRAHSRTVRMVT